MIRAFQHPQGLLFLEPFWRPDGTGVTLVEGEIRGEGPWKVGDCVVTVLGCHGTDAELAAQFAEWQFHLEQQGGVYEFDDQVEAVVREFAQRSE